MIELRAFVSWLLRDTAKHMGGMIMWMLTVPRAMFVWHRDAVLYGYVRDKRVDSVDVWAAYCMSVLIWVALVLLLMAMVAAVLPETTMLWVCPILGPILGHSMWVVPVMWLTAIWIAVKHKRFQIERERLINLLNE